MGFTMLSANLLGGITPYIYLIYSSCGAANLCAAANLSAAICLLRLLASSSAHWM